MTFINIIDQIHIESRRSLENSLLAAVGIAIVGLAGFISQVLGPSRILAVSSVASLQKLMLLFFLLLFAKVMNIVLEALLDSRRRSYGVAVFTVWALSLAGSAVGLAFVAYEWQQGLLLWAAQKQPS